MPLVSLEDFDLLFGEAMNSQAKGDVEMKKVALNLQDHSLVKSVPLRQICLVDVAKSPGIL